MAGLELVRPLRGAPPCHQPCPHRAGAWPVGGAIAALALATRRLLLALAAAKPVVSAAAAAGIGDGVGARRGRVALAAGGGSSSRLQLLHGQHLWQVLQYLIHAVGEACRWQPCPPGGRLRRRVAIAGRPPNGAAAAGAACGAGAAAHGAGAGVGQRLAGCHPGEAVPRARGRSGAAGGGQGGPHSGSCS